MPREPPYCRRRRASRSRCLQDLGKARLIAIADDGSVYLTRRAEGDFVIMRDAEDDGSTELRKTVACRPGMHGIAMQGRTPYLVAQEPRPEGPALVIIREETRATARLGVTSTTFAADRPIQHKFSAYGEDQSPALSWSWLPAGAAPTAIMIEDSAPRPTCRSSVGSPGTCPPASAACPKVCQRSCCSPTSRGCDGGATRAGRSAISGRVR